ncbi:allantoinase PuuE [Endozoicomonas numazuensis]|uniref:Allantoinase n=1 Tax=Endozoicomonas numazuensis TaxID=1137799 RepID=A0A081NEB2_9GAMM|nr:allantoinase PuuE [Endozoicomonas numazuensis]KEQ16785.1 allantoinase [Endozoicomonas numazuensis]
MDHRDNHYPRDLIGYGNTPPLPKWPEQSRIAVQFVINYEEGGENSVLHGDKGSEAFLSEIIGAQSYEGMRHISMESIYDYGARAGFWRLHRIFTQRNIPVTVYAVAMAMQRNPQVIQAMLDADWEIASHGYRWIDYQFHDLNEEREHMQKALQIHTEMTGQKPSGWYTGRCSPQTEQLVAEEGDFLYHADSYADDLPYWDTRFAKPQLVVPYTLDCNDMRFATAQGFNSGDQFFHYLKDTFDVLYEEGAEQPKMMSVGLHCRLVGRPGRAAALIRFLDYVQSKDSVWLCTREQIARHWHEQHPCEAPEAKVASVAEPA